LKIFAAREAARRWIGFSEDDVKIVRRRRKYQAAKARFFANALSRLRQGYGVPRDNAFHLHGALLISYQRSSDRQGLRARRRGWARPCCGAWSRCGCRPWSRTSSRRWCWSGRSGCGGGSGCSWGRRRCRRAARRGLNCNHNWRSGLEEADRRIGILRLIGIKPEVIQCAPANCVGVLVLRKGFGCPSYRIGNLSRSPRRAAKSGISQGAIVCPAWMLRRGVESDVA